MYARILLIMHIKWDDQVKPLPQAALYKCAKLSVHLLWIAPPLSGIFTEYNSRQENKETKIKWQRWERGESHKAMDLEEAYVREIM